MFRKIFCTVLTGFIFFMGTAQAYDLPKIYPAKETAETLRKFKMDWSHVEKFEREIKIALAENENLPASSPARVTEDPNLIFIAFYKGNAYYLDKYSIKIEKKSSARQSWSQRIFPIGQQVTPKTAKATAQNFCYYDNQMYNSLGRRSNLTAVADETDKKFLAECFKVGYYFAFGKEIDT